MGEAQGLNLSESDYDLGILHPAMRRMYEGSDFYNVGYWRATDGSRLERMKDAAARLVERHMEDDDGRDAVGRVLDVGCGLGACTNVFAQGYPNAQVVGVNYSLRQIEHARATFAGPRVTFEQMNACDLRFPDNSFDRVHSVEAAFHFRPRQTFLEEACRVLVPGGRLYLTDLLADGPMTIMPEENVISTAGAFADAMRAAGFDDVDVLCLREDTVLPFAGVLNAHAMRAFARTIETQVIDYVLVSGRKPA